ncbi:hypothetical protein CAEBREN_03827 [Caenorhabditis brenneri]|uniref:Uncharacterized protein n=1 Tax=Caenorhabditis brenneri TaxID=135651 RepID=G0PN97_CAEBE|nr:hypothetical protein CAEBREN_03827 [Caenorhabditis brenneri]
MEELTQQMASLVTALQRWHKMVN